MTMLTETESSRNIREIEERGIKYNGGRFSAADDAEYNAIYVEADTLPGIHHRKFDEHPDGYCHIFFDAREKNNSIRFNRTNRTIEWTVGAKDIVNPIIRKVLEAEIWARSLD